MIPDEQLRARALRAYELGRLRRARVYLLPVAALAALGIAAGFEPNSVLGFGVLAAVTLVGFAWRGESWARALPWGLAGGALAMWAPLLAEGSGHGCVGGMCVSWCLVACTGGGVAAGGLIAWGATRVPGGRWTFLLSGALSAAMIGGMGCSMYGSMGLIGMLVAVALSTIPIALLAPRGAAA